MRKIKEIDNSDEVRYFTGARLFFAQQASNILLSIKERKEYKAAEKRAAKTANDAIDEEVASRA